MIKKLFIILFLVMNISFIYSATPCFFDSQNSVNCLRISSSFNTFNLNFDNLTVLDNFKAEIYSKSNSINKIKLTIDPITHVVKNINPFTDPGVYILKITAFNRAGASKISNFEFIFDNLEPMPPSIPLNLNSNNISGQTQFKNISVYAYDLNNNLNSAPISYGINNSFNIVLTGLRSGVNYVKFKSRNTNNIFSKSLERIIYLNKPTPNKNLQISSINLDNLNLINDMTINYNTTKRNFYVSGTISAPNSIGAVVYVNGIETIVDSNSRFAQFIILNEGLNKIEVTNFNETIKTSVNINYINPRFNFLEINLSKIVKQNNLNSVNILGKVNYNIPFNVFLNGNFTSTITSINNIFNFNLNGLIPGKNLIYLQGINGKSFSKIIYYDTGLPTIKLLTPKTLANSKKLFFEITDDISIDETSINLNIGTTFFSNNKISKLGNYYFVDISNITDGIYNLNVNAKDLVGNLANLNIFNLNIHKSNTVIEDILLTSGKFIANKLFVRPGNNQIILKPSKFIAFKNIYLDGNIISNYEIKANNEVIINLNFINNSGILEFSFIDSSYKIYNQKISYFTDNLKPKINLDYISNSNSKIGRNILISGEILDSNFNWDTLKFNSEQNFIKYGNNFEIYLKVNSGTQNLLISGLDLAGNMLQNSNFAGILFGDVTKVQILNSNSNIDSQNYLGVFNSLDSTKKYINSYDGFNLGNVYISNNFKLPLQDRQGIRSLNLLGIENSKLNFNSINSFSVDSIKPIVYFTTNNLGQNILILDGTLSDINIDSIILTNSSGSLVTLNFGCTESFSKFSRCLNIGNLNNLNVNFSDMAGNKFSKFLTSNDLVSLTSLKNFNPNLKPKVFLSGNDKITNLVNYFIQGQIKSEAKIRSVKLMPSGVDCEFDDFNFYCKTSLFPGTNNFTIEVLDMAPKSKKINTSIVLDNSAFNVDISKLYGSSVFKLQNFYSITTPPQIIIDSNLSKSALIKLFVNGRSILVGNKTGNFTFNINLLPDVNNKENTTLNLNLLATDELGNTASSNSVVLIYNRILKTILQILVG